MFNLLILTACLCSSLSISEGSMSGYLTLQEVYSSLSSLSSLYPSLSTPLLLGSTSNLNSIQGLKISSPSPSPKSSLVLSASQSSGFPISTSAVLFFASTLLSLSPSPYLNYLLNTRDVYILPVMNPDAYAWTELAYSHGLGFVEFLTNRNYTRCKQINDNGVRLNRNWGYQWNTTGVSSPDPCNNTYPGTQAFSEAETYSVKNYFARNNVSIGVWVHYEGIGNQYVTPYTYRRGPQTFAGLEQDVYSRIGQVINSTSPGWGYGTSEELMGYTEDGSIIDWNAKNGAVALQVAIGEGLPNQTDIVDEIMPHMGVAFALMEMAGFYVYSTDEVWNWTRCGGNCISDNSTFEIFAEFRLENSGLVESTSMNLEFFIENIGNNSVEFVVVQGLIGYYNIYSGQNSEIILWNTATANSSSFKAEGFIIPMMTQAVIILTISVVADNTKLMQMPVNRQMIISFNDFTSLGFEISGYYLVNFTESVGNSEEYITAALIATSISIFAVLVLAGICVFRCRKRHLQNIKFERTPDSAPSIL